MTKWKFLKNMQVKRFLPISILLIGLFIAFIFGGADYISLETIRTNKEELKQFIQAKYTTSVIIFIFIYVVTTACSIPGAAILSLLGGYLYGVSLGAMFSLTGATIGACALYFAARTALGDTLKSRAGPAIVNMQDGFKKNSFSYMLFLRLVPVFPFFLVNLVPAFLQVRFSIYFFASVIGMQELTRRANEIVVTEYRPLEIYTLLIFEYLILVLVISFAVRWIERKIGSDERL